MTIKQGVDLSRWNIVSDYKKVKKAGIDFAILKIGGSEAGLFKDRRFETHYEGCKKAGISVGSYFYAGKDFINSARGLEAGRFCLSLLESRQFEFPIYIDIEENATAYREGATDAAISFCTLLEEHGYYAGIYGSDVSTFKSRVNIDRLTRFDKWVARYGKKPVYVKQYGMWQKTSEGVVDSIGGYVDLDEAYIDYKKIMKSKHLNGF